MAEKMPNMVPKWTQVGAASHRVAVPGAQVFELNFCPVFGVVFFPLLDALKTILDPNMAATWAHFGTMLGIFSVIVGCCFGILT